MDKETRDIFVNNLAGWAKNLIEHGRYPFRRVERWPALLTEGGESTPALVFWINRDSFMAGGILFVPLQDPQECFSDGVASARALGLRHFFTWSPAAIEIWEDLGGAAPKRHKALITEAGSFSQAGDFRWALQQILEELKPLSVMGAIAPAHLSAYYVANLCLSPLKASDTELVETIRSARVEGEAGESPSAAFLAQEKAYLVLVRLLALAGGGQIPENVQPEKLERAFELTLSYLGEPLAEVLRPERDEIALPYPSAVRFHHLFRRLGQLGWGHDPDRMQNVLEVLLRNRARQIGLRVENSAKEEPIAAGTLLINPVHPVPAAGPFQAVYQDRGLRALATLLRSWLELPPAELVSAEILDLAPRDAILRIEGTLLPRGGQTISASEREKVRLRLRTSWPNRRFALPPRSPRGLWETLHLLGLAAEGAAIDLRIPAEWLLTPCGDVLIDLLREHFTLLTLEDVQPQQIRLELVRQARPQQTTTLAGRHGQRSLAWRTLAEQPRSAWRLALFAPPSVFALFEEHRLTCAPVGATAHPGGLKNFLATSLGGFLWDLTTGGAPRPNPQDLAQECGNHRLPLPDADLLRHLDEQGDISPERLEQEIARWLGEFPDLEDAIPDSDREQGRISRETRMSEEESARIVETVFADGFPSFPEKYLFGIYRPPLQDFEITGPLRRTGEFLGTFELSDDLGNTFEVEGEETAQALVLASFAGKTPVRLPLDRTLTADILENYLAELAQLRRALLRETLSRRERSQAARQWARKIWNSLPLPPWDLVRE